MRGIAIAGAVVLASASRALGAPACVSVTIGPELQRKALTTLGVRDVAALAKQLQADVERRLATTKAHRGDRIELVLVDVQPSRPTFRQLADIPGLAYGSFAVGGAKVVGRIVAPDGAITPLHYSYSPPSLAWSLHAGTWGDAQYGLEDFSSRLGAGEVFAAR